MPFIHTPDSVAWKAAFEHYNWDRLAEAWDLVEEFGVGGAVAHDAEVLGGPDDSRAEDLLPVAVHGDAGR